MITQDELYFLSVAPKNLGHPFTDPEFLGRYYTCLSLAVDRMRDEDQQEVAKEAGRLQGFLARHEHFPEELKPPEPESP